MTPQKSTRRAAWGAPSDDPITATTQHTNASNAHTL